MSDILLEKIPEPAQNRLLAGHEAQRQLLEKHLLSGHMHHAFLFEGAKGIGKATLAFHFAHHILSLQSGERASGALWREPAADSPLWRQMGQDSCPSLLYIRRGLDPKSRKPRLAITVDDVRRVSRFLQQTASDSGRRIVIIDAAEDMNRNAANALLKTLEEPPAKVLFMLISHNLGLLLPTIRSRCQALRFQPLPEETLRRITAQLAALAGYQGNLAHNNAVFAQAEGSPRRALALLAENMAGSLQNTGALLQNAVFPAPQIQLLAENLGKRDNSAAYDIFMRFQLDFIRDKARGEAMAGNLASAAAWADFFDAQQQALGEAQAFNLDKKQFILVFLQQLHSFLHAHAQAKA